jgi:hypothetical protein
MNQIVHITQTRRRGGRKKMGGARYKSPPAAFNNTFRGCYAVSSTVVNLSLFLLCRPKSVIPLAVPSSTHRSSHRVVVPSSTRRLLVNFETGCFFKASEKHWFLKVCGGMCYFWIKIKIKKNNLVH